MTEQNPADSINEETEVDISFESYPVGDVFATQVILGLVPQLVVTADYDEDEDKLNFSVTAYGTDAPSEFLETIGSVLEDLIPRVALATAEAELKAEREEAEGEDVGSED